MPHHPSIFSSLLKIVPRRAEDHFVDVLIL